MTFYETPQLTVLDRFRNRLMRGGPRARADTTARPDPPRPTGFFRAQFHPFIPGHGADCIFQPFPIDTLPIDSLYIGHGEEI